MKKLLLLFAIACVATTMSSAGAQSTLSLQEKCSIAAKEFFVSRYKTVDDTPELGQCLSSYQCHYNKKLDKCFILVSGSCAKKDESSQSADLGDVFEDKPYAYYTGVFTKDGALKGRICLLGDTQLNVLNGHEFNKQTKKWDVISDAYLHSLKEPFSDPVRTKFDNWVKPYMEE